MVIRPHYLPREIPYIIAVVVYVPPSADTTLAADKLCDTINLAEEKHPDAVKIVMGDFNSLKMDSHLPHYKQFVTFPTRDDKILDMFYCNIKGSYSAYKKAPLGASDHNMIHLLPKYRQIIKREKPTEVQVTKWSTERVEVLRGCFDITDWSVFQSDNGNYDIGAMTDYINFCVECNIPSKTVKCYPNNKPWVTKDPKLLINQKKAAFHSNDTNNLRTINEQLKKAIESKKKIYKEKIEDQLKSNDSRKAWDGLKTITGYKKKSNLPSVENNETFANELNEFYSRFDTHDFSDECDKLLQQLHVQNDESPKVTVSDVNNALSKIKIRKAPGPDRVSGKVLKECRLQLAPTLREIFQH